MPLGTMSTYQLNVGVQLDVEDVIWIISPFDVPLLGTNGADGRTTLSRDVAFEKMIQWLDESLLTPRSALAATANTADTTVTLTTGDGIKFQTGDLLVIDAERFRVTATTTDVLTVTRAYGSTTAVIHNNLTVVVGIGSANTEGADVTTARAADRSLRTNMTEIFGPYAVTVSGTQNAVRKYGLVGTEFDKQVANRTKEMFIAVEQTLLYGTRNEDTTNSIRSMGGFDFWITTNVDSTTTSLTETLLLTQIQACYDAGGLPDRIVVGSKQKRNISQFGSGNIRYAQDTDVRGQVVDWYDSDFGRISVILDRWTRTQNLFIFARDQATVVTLRPATFEMLAKTGDAIKGQVLAELSMRFRRQTWAALFNALT